MIPVITKFRMEQENGLWANKLSGSFQEGDSKTTRFFVEGKVEIKELGGHLRAYFKDVKLTARVSNEKKLDDEEKEKDSDDSGSSSDEETVDKKKQDGQAEEAVVVPKLSVYMTTKKPKKRMVDAHKTGTKVKMVGMTEGTFGKLDQVLEYDTPLVDISDVSNYKGLVVIKMPADDPPTEEPVIYGYVRLQSMRSIRVKSIDALHLSDLSDMLVKLTNRAAILRDSMTLGPNVKKGLKPLHVYRRIAEKAWSHLGKQEEELADFDEVLKMLDYLDLFMLNIQALRIFDVVDLKKSGKISLSDFENLLIAKEILTPLSKEIKSLDVFDSLKAEPINPEKILEKEKELEKNKTKPAFILYSRKKHFGLDYPSFIEAVQILGYKPDEDLEDPNEPIKDAFCFGAGIKEKDVDTTYLTLPEFRKGWLKIADIPAEMEKRNIKPEGGLFAESRNRERLSQAINETEGTYVKNLGNVNEFITNLKADHRRKKDEHRRQKEAHREKLLHEANKFMAERAKEKRLQIKREQEEKSKKRSEDKILRNKLLQRQQENLEMKRQEIAKSMNEATRLKLHEIKAQGLDRLDISVRNLREIPLYLYDNNDAHMKLSYVVTADMSHNILDFLPEEKFLYWMTETRKLKLSQNRLKRLPEELGDLGKVEILELESNRLEALPHSFGQLRSLQRLDISNNQLISLPDVIGQCASLKYLNVHSNLLNSLPASIGDCFQLEYLDCSRNEIRELPEDMEHLVSLTHFDLSSNQVGHLPHHIGQCKALQYLDMSCNVLASIPESFSKLSMLEYCNLENNAIIAASHCFGNVRNIKYLNLRKNQIRFFTSDFGAMSNLTKLDISLNHLEFLPIEIGLMAHLETLKLDRNYLTTIPPELGSCLGLQTLNISYNAITGCLPETLSLIRGITELNISFNKIDDLPRSIVAFRELVTLNAQQCLLQRLPDTIVTLDRLEVIELPNNRFTIFPIELHTMKKLRRLNLANNAIRLLPRNINTMTRLESLDLSRNQLQALPVEFVDVFESVSEVNLHENPWDLLPPKWGRRRAGKESTDAPKGYSLADALDFLYNTRIIYDTCEEIWADLGAFFFTGRIGLDDFLQELRDRIPKNWHEGLVEYATHIFFQCKQSGVFIKWYSLSPEQERELAERTEQTLRMRETNIMRSRNDVLIRTANMNQAYNKDLFRRVRQAEDLIAEHSKNEDYIETMKLKGLHQNVVRSEMNSVSRRSQMDRVGETLRKKELNRLYSMIDADKKTTEELKKLIPPLDKK